MNDCLFCKITRQEIPSALIYQDETVFAFLDIKPVAPGHLLIVPKQHSEGFHDADPAVLAKLLPMIQTLAAKLVTATNAEGYNLIQNNKPAAGQVIPHLHYHLIPRFEGDGLEPWHGTPYASEADMKAMQEKIQNA